jgi:hypothetical protein
VPNQNFLAQKQAAVTMPMQLLETAGGHVRHLSGEPVSAERLCAALEEGAILYFPKSPIFPEASDWEFLLAQRQLESARHKNIAYRPQEDRITGIDAQTDRERLHRILKQYSQQVGAFLDELLVPYQGWHWDYASYRPLEEQGRRLRLRARNDLIHVDSFPTRPTYGGRILRFFTNLHPERVRVWQTSDPFDVVAPQFANRLRLRGELATQSPGLMGGLQALLKRIGVKQTHRSGYDQWMTALHNAMKEDREFQQHCRKDRWEFPPGSAWMVFTDGVSHSVLSGQFALEQTVIVPPDKMVRPEKSPLQQLKQFYAS